MDLRHTAVQSRPKQLALQAIVALLVGITFSVTSITPADAAPQKPPTHAELINRECSSTNFDVLGCLSVILLGNFFVSKKLVAQAVSNEPDLFSAVFASNYAITFNMALVLTLAMALLGAVIGIMKGDLRYLIRTFVIGIPVALLGAGIAVAGASVLQRIDLAISSHFLDQLEVDFNKWNEIMLIHFDLLSQDDVGKMFHFIIMVFIYFFGIVFTILLVMELYFRDVMVYLGVLFVPIALAFYVLESTRKWATQIITMTVGMTFFKMIIIITLAFSFRMLVSISPDGGAGTRTLLTLTIMSVMVWAGACASGPLIFLFIWKLDHYWYHRREFLAQAPWGSLKAKVYVGSVRMILRK